MLSNKLFKTSLSNKNKKGEREPPCLIPIKPIILPRGLPLMETKNLATLMQPLIQLIHLFPNLFSKDSNQKGPI